MNAHLIGVPGSRHKLDTPALLLDLPALQRNVARMAAHAKSRCIGLRPHVKSHKSVEIARAQIEAGALGVCCATLGEAEAMIDADLPGVLITSPVIGPGKLCRLVALAARTAPGGLMVVVDHPENVRALSACAAALPTPLHVLIDYQAGYGRTGVADAYAALALAREIARTDSLCLRGLQAYGGHLQHIGERREREAAAARLREEIAALVAALAAHGIALDIVTGVGTGTYDFDTGGDVFTEIQPGSYVFMDAEYAAVLQEPMRPLPFETSLFVQSTVVSTNAGEWVTVDAGTKSFATDSVMPVVARGGYGYARYAFFGDEHGKLIVDRPLRPPLGARIEFVVPHCDPTVNLHSHYHLVSGDTLIGIWPVRARGRF